MDASTPTQTPSTRTPSSSSDKRGSRSATTSSTGSSKSAGKKRGSRLSLSRQRAERRARDRRTAASATAAGEAETAEPALSVAAAPAASGSDAMDTRGRSTSDGGNEETLLEADTVSASISAAATGTTAIDTAAAAATTIAVANSETSKAAAAAPTKPAYMRTPVNRDDLAAFKLRTRLGDMKFMKFWHIMDDQNWRHNTAQYYSPQGRRLGTAIETFAYLDRYGMPRRGEPGMTLEEYNSEEAIRARKLRDDLLEGYFRHQKYVERRKRKGGAGTETEVELNSADDDHDDEDLGPALFSLGGDGTPIKNGRDGGNSGDGRKNPGGSISQGGAKRRQTSSIDAGAQAYMEGTKRKTRSKRRLAGKGDPAPAEESKNEPEYHVWPDPETNVTVVRDYAAEISGNNITALDEDYVSDFGEWKFLLSTNHSLLLYGFGSKRSILNDFAQAVLPQEGDVLTLDGFDRTINIEEILTTLVHLYLGGHEPRPRSSISREKALSLGIVPPTQGSPAVVRRALAIAERMAATRPAPLYLVLHNIDGVGLRYRHTQDALAILIAGSIGKGGSRMIRLASSVDHVNASGMLWTTQTRACFAWVSSDHVHDSMGQVSSLGGI